ncbi:MAG: ArsA-related P-loop ATPase, partial [Bdellovibrionota bacterium]
FGGKGGVGKTTLSVAMALRAATLGRKAVVLTLDPAKRLATSLGMDSASVGDTPLDLTARLRETIPHLTGRFAAIMPDTGRTFDAFVSTLSDDPSVLQSIRRNPIFEMISREYSGSNEYMAMVRMHQLHRTGEYDLIVLDTPPSRNAVAFLDAPQLLARFFDERMVRWFVLPTNQLFATGMRKAFGILESLTGSAFVSNLFDFGARLFDVRARFSRDLDEIMKILRSPDCTFGMVTAPHAEAHSDFRALRENLRDRKLGFDVLFANRLLGAIPLAAAGAIADQSPIVLRAHDQFIRMREFETRHLTALTREALREQILFSKVPELARDVHTLDDLV